MWIFDCADRDGCSPRRSGAVGVLWGRFGPLVAAAWARACARVGSLFCGTGLRGGAGRCRGLSVVGVVVAVLASVVVPAGAASAAVGGPGAPGGLSAVSVEGGVLLSWDAPEAEAGGGGVSGYRVLRRRPEQGERSLSVLVSDTGSAQTSYLDESAAVEGELFVYRVVALSGGVAGERSALARVRYAAPEPEPVVRVEPEPEPVVRVEPAPEPVEPEPVTDPVAEPEAVGVVWSGVLSVGFEGSVVPAMSGFSVWARRGSLSPRSFSVDGSAVRVLVLVEHAGGVFLAMDQAMGTDFVLDVGGREFAGSDSLVPALAVRGAYWWPSGGLSWSDGDTVDVELRVAAGAVPIGARDAAPVWAYFDRVPDVHDGAGEFGVRLRFGEDVDTGAAALRDSVLAVSGGSVTAVEPAAAGSTRDWSVTVQPDGAGDVTVSVGGGLGCADAAAVCTADGRTLPAGIAVSVAGPAASVALAALGADGAVLAPVFSPEVALYSAQADTGVTHVTVTAEARDSAASVEILPADADASTAGHQVTVTAGAQTAVSVTVTAAGGNSSRRYWLVVDGPREPGGGAVVQTVPGLTGLALDGLAALGFTPAEHRYETEKVPEVTTATVVASSDDSDAVVEVLVVRSDDSPLVIDTADADPYAAGHQVALSEAGETLVLVVVTSADAKRQDVYLVLVRQPAIQLPPAPGAPVTKSAAAPVTKGAAAPGLPRGPVSNAAPRDGAVPALSALSLDGVALTPQFAAATVNYTATVAAEVDHVTVAASPAGDASVMLAPADADANTAGWQVALPAADPGGAPTQTSIAAIVTAGDGMAVNAYLVAVSREAPLSADTALDTLTLTGATLAPAFTANVHDYAATVANTVEEVTVAATAAHTGATVAIAPGDSDTTADGWQVALAEGDNTVTVTVTAADEVTTENYTVTVTRDAAVDDATLAALVLDGVALSPAFDPATFIYTADVDAGTEHVTLDLTTASTDATVTIVPADDDPNTAGWQIALTAVQPGGQPSTTAVAIVVTAADTNTRLTYTVTVTRHASSASSLPLAGLPAELPEGCRALRLNETSDGTLTKTLRWRNWCDSILWFDLLYEHEFMVPGFGRFFRFDVTQPSDVAIKLKNFDGTHHYVLRSADGTQLQHVFWHHVLHLAGSQCIEWYGFVCAEESVLEATLPVGTYIVELIEHYSYASWYDSSEARFTVEVSGDFVASASPRLMGLTVDGEDVESFNPNVFAVEAFSSVEVATLAVETMPATPPHTVLIEPADADPDTAGHQVEFDEHGPTDVVITVADAFGLVAPSYAVTILVEPGASTATLGRVAVGSSARGTIHQKDEHDWFAVELDAGVVYKINLEGESSAGTYTLLDPELSMRDSDGTLIPHTSAEGRGGDAELWFDPPVSGKYFIDVRSWNSTGTYELSVTQTTLTDDFASDTATSEVVVVDGEAVEGAVDYPRDRDWHAVTLDAGKTYVIELRGRPTGDGTLKNPHLYNLRDASGAGIGGTSDGDSGRGANAKAVFTPTVTGKYFVSAGGFNNPHVYRGVGTYELSVSEVT